MNFDALFKDCPSSVVTTISGGMDSTVLLYILKQRGVDVRAVSVDYGQRHRKELQLARETCVKLGVPHNIITFLGFAEAMQNSVLTNHDKLVPDGHYAEESMKDTVVPNRNMLLLGIASAVAMSNEAGAVTYAAHAGDHTIYPDCRQEFVDALGVAIGLADWHSVELLAPFASITKADIVTCGDIAKVPWTETWTCYKGGNVHCGTCGTCVERREAFVIAGVHDPTEYEVPLEESKALWEVEA